MRGIRTMNKVVKTENEKIAALDFADALGNPGLQPRERVHLTPRVKLI